MLFIQIHRWFMIPSKDSHDCKLRVSLSSSHEKRPCGVGLFPARRCILSSFKHFQMVKLGRPPSSTPSSEGTSTSHPIAARVTSDLPNPGPSPPRTVRGGALQFVHRGVSRDAEAGATGGGRNEGGGEDAGRCGSEPG